MAKCFIFHKMGDNIVQCFYCWAWHGDNIAHCSSFHHFGDNMAQGLLYPFAWWQPMYCSGGFFFIGSLDSGDSTVCLWLRDNMVQQLYLHCCSVIFRVFFSFMSLSFPCHCHFIWTCPIFCLYKIYSNPAAKIWTIPAKLIELYSGIVICVIQ